MTGPPGREPVVNMDEFSAHKVETAIKLDARRTAVLVIDMLNDFCKPGGAMVLPGYERLIGPQRAVISAARSQTLRSSSSPQHLQKGAASSF